MPRGSPYGNLEMMAEGYEQGLGFLKGVAIDQHFTQRRRHADMTKLMKSYPQYLGIGIDESTALIVRGHTADVVGAGRAFFYDYRRPIAAGQPDHEVVPPGSQYDLKARTVLGQER
jgi:cyanophycinase-like exopeptidase